MSQVYQQGRSPCLWGTQSLSTVHCSLRDAELGPIVPVFRYRVVYFTAVLRVLRVSTQALGGRRHCPRKWKVTRGTIVVWL